MTTSNSDSKKAGIFRDLNGFISNLEKHHASLGTLYRNVPILPINIDLFYLYHYVRSRGGFYEVTRKKEWPFIAKQLCYPPHTVPRIAQLLYYQYYQLLFSFEVSHSRSQRQGHCLSSLPNVIIPALYEPPADEDSVFSLTRLRCSLLSGLPNEVELAINTLVILSSKKQFHLTNEMSILDLLLAHVGIFRGVDLWNLFNSHDYAGKHNIDQVWSQLLLPDPYLRYITQTDCVADSLCEEYREILAPLEVAEKGDYIYRLYAVATILYNACYLEENSSIMIEHNQSIRFLLASISCNNVILQHFAWDSLSILGEKVPLFSDELCSDELLQLVLVSIVSEDNFVLLRNLEVIRCIAAANIDMNIPEQILHHIIRLLTLSDVQLLLRCVETLYQLTEVSTTNCNYIITSIHGIDVLVTCLTRDVDALACQSASRFAMVKEIHKEEELARGVPPNIHYCIKSLCEESNAVATVVETAKSTPSEPQGFGPDELAKKWLKSCFEYCFKGTISKTQLYSGYHAYLKNIFQNQSSLGFMRLLEHIRQIFPKATLKKALGVDGKSSFVFYFLRIKQHITVEDISLPSVITSDSSPFTTPAKLKMNPICKISPVPPLMNHAHSNNKLIPSKLRNSVDPVKPNLPHKFVIKNIFNNANIDKETFRKPPFLPLLQTSTQPNPVSTSPPTETPKSPLLDNHNDAMILQIPIEFYQTPPVTPQSHSTEPYLENGHNSPTPIGEDPSILKKRPQPSSSPNFVTSSKKHTPNTPPASTNFNHTDMSPVNGNGDSHLVNGDANNFDWNNIDQINSEKKEYIKQLTSPNNLCDVKSPLNDLKASHIERREFPFVSISFSPPVPKSPEINSKVSVEDSTTPQKPLSPPLDVTAVDQISTPAEVDSPLGGKKIRKFQKEKPNSTPTCQWQGCSRSFDEWDELLKHACSKHADSDYPTICMWLGCKTHRNTRSRPSLMRHFQVCHCTPNPIQPKIVSVAHLLDKLKRVSPLEKTSEGVLSRSLHLTTALILRNVLHKCPESIGSFAAHEHALLSVATTDSHAGHYITEILSEISSYKHSNL